MYTFKTVLFSICMNQTQNSVFCAKPLNVSVIYSLPEHIQKLFTVEFASGVSF